MDRDYTTWVLRGRIPASKPHFSRCTELTGGRFTTFARGETDISNASRPILKEEMAATANGIEYVELPICVDALTVA
jgi:hypothetical protein